MYFSLLGTSPVFAAEWLNGLLAAYQALTEFPGPRAYAVDLEASQLFGRETRPFLYFGPHSRRSRNAQRIFYCVIAPRTVDDEAVIRILRIRYGAQLLTPEDNDEDNT